jgi:hypothetical protein
MALLGELRIIEALARPLEIGAGVLAVVIKEQFIEAAIEVLMVSDIMLGAPLVVALAYGAQL